MKASLFLAALGWALALCSCAEMRPLRGGGAKANAQEATIQQPENPAASSDQSFETETEEKLLLPPGSIIRTMEQTGTNTAVSSEIQLASPAELQRIRKHATKQTIGPAQKDLAREFAVKIKSFRTVQVCGGILILAALAMFYGPVRLLVRSTTLQVVTGATGLFLLFAPYIIVGNERLILVVGIAVPVIYFLIHRHGRLQGLVDANKNGIPDHLETPQS